MEAEAFSKEKAALAAAVSAEGIPINPSYRHLPAEAQWFRERKVFPPSDYPWGLQDYQGDREAQFTCPNAVESVESHFIVSIHERWTDTDADDAVAALRKVADASRA